jgi:hypothetical protein
MGQPCALHLAGPLDVLLGQPGDRGRLRAHGAGRGALGPRGAGGQHHNPYLLLWERQYERYGLYIYWGIAAQDSLEDCTRKLIAAWGEAWPRAAALFSTHLHGRALEDVCEECDDSCD